MKKLFCLAFIGVALMMSCAKIEIEQQDYDIKKNGNIVLLYNHIDSLIVNLPNPDLIEKSVKTDTILGCDKIIMKELRARVSSFKNVSVANTIRNVSFIEKEFDVELAIPVLNTDGSDTRVQTSFSFLREVPSVQTKKGTEECYCGFVFYVTPHLVEYIQDLDHPNPYYTAVVEFDVDVTENTEPIGSFSFTRYFVLEAHAISFDAFVEGWEAAEEEQVLT